MQQLLIWNFRYNRLQKQMVSIYCNDSFILSYYNNFSLYIKASIAAGNYKLLQLIIVGAII